MTFGSFDDDERTRHLLRSVLDEPPPPASTSAADVIRRGRRRVLVQRTSAIAGVVVVVAAIGVVSMWFGSPASDDSSGVRVGNAPSSTTTSGLSDWTRVAAPPASVTTTTVTGSPVGPPTTLGPEAPWAAGHCNLAVVSSRGATIRPRSDVEPLFTTAVAAQVGDAPTSTRAEWEPFSAQTQAARGFVEILVSGPAGNNSVRLEVVPFLGDPLAVADADVARDCPAPLRLVQEDGSVLQLYDANTAHPEFPSQQLRIYQPDGQLYVVTVAGWSDRTVDGGTGQLPLTAEELAEVGIRMATLQ